jgi:hypothetical protein
MLVRLFHRGDDHSGGAQGQSANSFEQPVANRTCRASGMAASSSPRPERDEKRLQNAHRYLWPRVKGTGSGLVSLGANEVEEFNTSLLIGELQLF